MNRSSFEKALHESGVPAVDANEITKALIPFDLAPSVRRNESGSGIMVASLRYVVKNEDVAIVSRIWKIAQGVFASGFCDEDPENNRVAFLVKVVVDCFLLVKTLVDRGVVLTTQEYEVLSALRAAKTGLALDVLTRICGYSVEGPLSSLLSRKTLSGDSVVLVNELSDGRWKAENV